MAKVKYYINVETISELSNKKKMELLRKFKEFVTVIKKEYPDIDITISRELTNDDIMESLQPIPPDSVTRVFTEDLYADTCEYYDEAQGRHKCIHPSVTTHRCFGLCPYFE